MKILFSPSESKTDGGEKDIYFNLNTMYFSDVKNCRRDIVNSYEEYIATADVEDIQRLFGIKKLEECKTYLEKFEKQKVMMAAYRYSGVAFEYLDIFTLSDSAKNYILDNTIIFSNLFGPLKASDMIPNYKLKQSESFSGLNVEYLYNKAFSNLINSKIDDDDILDLRANYYEKFFKPNKNYRTIKFLKNGKVVSHFAKAYRGLILRELAINDISNFEIFDKHIFANLKLEEIKIQKNKNEYIYTIID